jgi:hypothetical protein
MSESVHSSRKIQCGVNHKVFHIVSVTAYPITLYLLFYVDENLISHSKRVTQIKCIKNKELIRIVSPEKENTTEDCIIRSVTCVGHLIRYYYGNQLKEDATFVGDEKCIQILV